MKMPKLPSGLKNVFESKILWFIVLAFLAYKFLFSPFAAGLKNLIPGVGSSDNQKTDEVDKLVLGKPNYDDTVHKSVAELIWMQCKRTLFFGWDDIYQIVKDYDFNQADKDSIYNAFGIRSRFLFDSGDMYFYFNLRARGTDMEDKFKTYWNY